MRRSSLAVLALAPWSAFASAPPIGYAQATGYFKKDTRPTLYQPLNLLDGREVTAWCSPTADPLSEQITFGFKDAARIDEVRVYTGNGFDDSTWKEFSRAKKLSLKGPVAGAKFQVADERGLQSVPINPPLVGARFTLEVLDQYPSEDPDAPVCITDIVFYSEGKPLNGSWLTQKLKYDKGRAQLMGTWFAGPEGAPDHFLSFYFDGSFQYSYEPFDPTVKHKSFHGEYDASGSRLALDLPGKGRVSVRIHRDKKGDDAGARTLNLEGDLPEDMKLTFRDKI
ncbi:MAG TPA: hypothetical protein VH208_09560 [Myxococcaceae bacterium]|nr:hypothetical protein [Myxococcaceae bacterium]